MNVPASNNALIHQIQALTDPDVVHLLEVALLSPQSPSLDDDSVEQSSALAEPLVPYGASEPSLQSRLAALVQVVSGHPDVQLMRELSALVAHQLRKGGKALSAGRFDAAVQQGIDDIAAGRVVSHEEVGQRIAQWKREATR